MLTVNPLKRYLPLAIILSLPLINSCNQLDIGSQWITQPMVIDGQAADWQGMLVFPEKEALGLGVANDADNLYLCIITSDPQLRRLIMVRGLTIWINVQGKRKQTYGIKYPLGLLAGGFAPGKIRPENRNWDRFAPEMVRLSTEFEILVDKKQGVRIPVYGNNHQIVLKYRVNHDQFIYELKLPFNQIFQETTVPVLEDGQSATLGFQVAELDINTFRAGRGGQRPFRSSGSMPAGGRQGRSRGYGAPRARPAEGLEFWIEITLATPQQ